MSILSILSILGFAKLFRNFIKFNPNFSYLVSISFIVSLLFLFGLINLLLIGNYLILVTGILLLIFLYHDKNYFFQDFFFISAAIIWFFYSNFLHLKVWDDFFWAQYTKVIFFEKKLYTASSFLQNHPRYTPGMPLFQNFFTFSLNNFKDKYLFFANGIIIISFLFAFIKPNFYKKSSTNFIFKTLFILLITLVIFWIFNHGFLYVEFYLSIMICSSVIMLIYSKNRYLDLIYILPTLGFLFLIKETSNIYVILISFLAFIKSDKNKIIYSFIIATFIFFIIFLWNTHVYLGGSESSSLFFFYKKIFEYTENYKEHISLSINALNSVILDYGNFTSITRKFYLSDFATTHWMIMSFFLYLVIHINNYEKSKDLRIVYLFSPIYYFIIFFIDFSLNDKKIIHFNRLSSTFVVFIFLLQIYIIFNSKEIKDYFYKKIVTFFSFFFLFIFLVFNNQIIKSYNSYRENNKTHQDVINMIKNNAFAVNDNVNEQSKIYFIHQASSGFHKTVFNYYAYPNEVNSEAWSLGPPYHKIDKYYDDIWTSNLSNNEIIFFLKYNIPHLNKFRDRDCCKMFKYKKYDYIFLSFKDEKLWNAISFLFKNKDEFNNYNFYKISYTLDKIYFMPIF